MIMMMTDSDRVALPAFSACISSLFHSPLHANTNAHFPSECHNLSYIILPPSDPRLPFTPLVSSHFPSTVRASQTAIIFLAFSLSCFCSTPQPVLFHFYLFAANNNQKLAIKITSSPPPSFLASQHTHTHLLRSLIYVSITPGGIYLAQKEGFC
jgi:hypothetical protein